MESGICPQCGNNVSVGAQPKLGKILTCSECGTDLEIIWLDPVELDFPIEEDEYEEDDFDDEE